MSEESRQLTPAEIEAYVANKMAEGEFFHAQAAKENKLAEIEDIRLRGLRHDADRADEKRRDELAANKYHHVYLFDKDVNEGTTKACVQQLTDWVRVATDPVTVELVINSPGGGIFEGFALIDYIDSLHTAGHTVNTTVYGMAASMGGVLLQVGKKRSIGKNAMLLIHEASFGANGSFGEIEDRVKLVELMHERILDLFTSRAQPINAKTTKAFIVRNWKRKDWWMTAETALKHGFVDNVL